MANLSGELQPEGADLQLKVLTSLCRWSSIGDMLTAEAPRNFLLPRCMWRCEMVRCSTMPQADQIFDLHSPFGSAHSVSRLVFMSRIQRLRRRGCLLHE